MDLPIRAVSLHLHLFISVNQRPSAFQSRDAKLWWACARRDGPCPPYRLRSGLRPENPHAQSTAAIPRRLRSGGAGQDFK